MVANLYFTRYPVIMIEVSHYLNVKRFFSHDDGLMVSLWFSQNCCLIGQVIEAVFSACVIHVLCL